MFSCILTTFSVRRDFYDDLEARDFFDDLEARDFEELEARDEVFQWWA